MSTVASQLAGLTGPQIAEKVAAGEVSEKAARAYVLDRASNKFAKQIANAQPQQES